MLTQTAVKTDTFNYFLPDDLIAQHPAPTRDQSRLLVFHRPGGAVDHMRFPDFPNLLRPGDLLVLNNSKVIPARMRGIKKQTGGAIEFLLLEEIALNDWWVMLRPSKRLHPGDFFELVDFENAEVGIRAKLLEKNPEGHCRLQFDATKNILEVAQQIGEMPLPPYIARDAGRTRAEDMERYQTVFAREEGSVAAPTAGLHFTPRIFEDLKARGIETAFVTLHVGAGTFAPVKVNDIENHRMHEERYEISQDAFEKIQNTKSRGGRIICAGTTSLRVLESAARTAWSPGPNRTNIFIYPPFEFRIADALLTNFHLPKSTLLMLVSAFATPGSIDGIQKILRAYDEAVNERYRFFSYGDAMFLTPKLTSESWE
jgi:S-adenosylmethionine:tRNA ribosyltransferase-isomerase